MALFWSFMTVDLEDFNIHFEVSFIVVSLSIHLGSVCLPVLGRFVQFGFWELEDKAMVVRQQQSY